MEQVRAVQTLVAGSGDSARAERVNADQRGARVGRVVGAVIAAIGRSAGRWRIAAIHAWRQPLLDRERHRLCGLRRVAMASPTSGAWLVVAVFAGTVAWALWEVGFNYWALFPRILPPAGLAFLALLATLRFPANKSWRIAAHTAGVLGLLIGVQFAFAFVPHGTVHTRRSRPFLASEQSGIGELIYICLFAYRAANYSRRNGIAWCSRAGSSAPS